MFIIFQRFFSTFLNFFSTLSGLFSNILIFPLQNPHTPTPTGPTAPPTTTPAPEIRQISVRVIDASKNTLIPSVDYSYTVDQGNEQTDNAVTGEFNLTVPLNSNVELTVMKDGFYDNVQSGLIDEDKNWLIVMIPSVTTTSSIMAG